MKVWLFLSAHPQIASKNHLRNQSPVCGAQIAQVNFKHWSQDTVSFGGGVDNKFPPSITEFEYTHFFAVTIFWFIMQVYLQKNP